MLNGFLGFSQKGVRFVWEGKVSAFNRRGRKASPSLKQNYHCKKRCSFDEAAYYLVTVRLLHLYFLTFDKH